MSTPNSVTLLGAAEIRRLADELAVRPTKTLGQNFVHDGNTVRRIVAAADLRSTDHVLEVGPGLGSLTLGLLCAAAAVTAVEIDRRLADRLPTTVAEHAPDRAFALRVVHGDALTVTEADLRSLSDLPAPEDPTALVANLPYNVAVPVLLHLLAELSTLRRVLVMVQAEVADRLAAQPGGKDYGVPSVKAAWYGTARRAGSISRSVFWPVPGVDSALVAIDVHPHPRTDDRAAVFAAIDAAFAQRRKTLRVALASWAGSTEAAQEVLERAGVDPSARGETLTVDEFAAIAEARTVLDAAVRTE
ncbi:16S rRNA (adenine(1518)-N(6)/adenine(1519)-N(6))-dimethyltransferase RsmA [Nakamurella leprariae]|uniref:Ribosomal RNA small subunit methyltransferase A n=1 Tax=Nakamurella leprariae TaxID=2803911 RepID=A0A939C312_9ACTN|nr:16S rRNA (adenine(1518)-N(6)/adenine(1519)-N(6))-dimethyltransferase RsmA [Nakamurella leprariae]MBM9468642.1 16S rRNA (adenine(1518)-N(6)/adenine(1519)-N(6))-dimethyltransferase RsmA [Nakamurella leprariae]